MKKASKYDKSRIMREAHELYRLRKRNGYTFSYCLKDAWEEAKIRVKVAEMKAEAEAKAEAKWRAWSEQKHAENAKRRAEHEAELKRLGVDEYTYGLMHEYGRRGVYYGD